MRHGLEPRWFLSHPDRANAVARILLYTDTPFKAGNRRVHLMIRCAGFASRALEIRTATMASARCHLAKGEAFKATEVPTRAAYKMAVKYFGQLQTTGVFADDHPAIQMVKAGLDPARAASDESVSSARGFEQARIRPPCTRGISKRPTIDCSRLSRAFWPLSKAWNSTEPRSWRSRSRCKSGGITWSSFTDKLQLKSRTDPRPLSCRSWSRMESASSCPRRQRTASRKLQSL